MNDVTVVITSCGRVNLLRETINSFMTFNTYTISKIILIDDSGNSGVHSEIKKLYPNFTLIFNENRIGQIKSIDKAYSYVKTPYIFHLEDDWKFYKHSFIEDSLKILQSDKQIITVWLRELNDTNKHPYHKKLHTITNVSYYEIVSNWNGGWSGFTFNPGLRRLSDYNLVCPYEKYIPGNKQYIKYYTPELELSIHYNKLGYKAVITNDGYVKHIGWDSHIN
jgi:hypothetical protein